MSERERDNARRAKLFKEFVLPSRFSAEATDDMAILRQRVTEIENRLVVLHRDMNYLLDKEDGEGDYDGEC